MMVNGRGGPADIATAVELFEKAAAELGRGQAQVMLGRHLAQGAAGEPNPEAARRWLEQAAAQGIEEAKGGLATLPAGCRERLSGSGRLACRRPCPYYAWASRHPVRMRRRVIKRPTMANPRTAPELGSGTSKEANAAPSGMAKGGSPGV
jgi:TPR repeat protein